MKKISGIGLFLLLCCVLSNFCFAQSGGKIAFENNSHNFGSVNEENGPITHEFSFLNTGTAPVTIVNVKASCGCTTPGWSKDPVQPGEKGFIKAQYNPTNRPGAFNKSLTVTTDGEPSSVILFISGTVLPKQRNPKDDFPKKIGAARISTDKIDLGKIYTKDTLTRIIKIYNDSDKPLVISQKNIAPKHITLKVETETIAPNQIGAIKFTYEPLKRNDYGEVNDQIIISTNEETENKKVFLIKAEIADFFQPLTDAELAAAPKLELEKTEIDLGKVKPGQVVKTDFELRNIGKQELQIKRVKSNSTNVTTNFEKGAIKTGAHTKLKIAYTAPQTEGVDNKVVYIYSNSPSGPVQTILIKAEVLKEVK